MPEFELDKVYDPRCVELEIYRNWEGSGAFRAFPDGSPPERTFTIVMPPPNVTGALHLGHALNNTLQDILIRYHRMRGFNTLWQPGTDHAGIATQAVVERRIREQEGKTRQEIGREALVERIWRWKDEYEKRIIGQLKLMGCSCDWDRLCFTFDEPRARAVRHMFFNLFKDGLIFRGKRLVNWDTQLQTAVSDDEVYHETVKGHFYHIRYPVIPSEPRAPALHAKRQGSARAISANGEPEFVVIATTRPETMLADTAVAVHPDPEGFFNRRQAELRDAIEKAVGKDRAEIEAKLAALRERRESHLSRLVRLRDMARAGRKLRLPLVEREIPLIADEWADPTLGSGCVKITPAHDPNDYEVGLRHGLPMINVLTPDGKIAPIIEPDGSRNPHGSRYEGLPFAGEGRARVVADLQERGLLESIEDRDIEIGHSDRSKLPIEPFLSDQWFIRTGDIEANNGQGTKARRHEDTEAGALGIVLGDGRRAPGLAQAAMEAVTGGRIRVFPERYGKTYLDWLSEKRDWCISRQLWWGHRIPIWSAGAFIGNIVEDTLTPNQERWEKEGRLWRKEREPCELSETSITPMERASDPRLQQYCVRDPADTEIMTALESWGYEEDEDVLDTWFSSALWPFSTLGWPEETLYLKQYYPGSVLCTSRGIITNWVARMVMFGLYGMGGDPFRHVYIHPTILDGRGETMSKSKGNGVDPVDIIHLYGADAMRYTLADMTTETQDIRMPVDYVCPHCGKLTEQAAVLKAEEQARKSRGIKLERRLQPADCARARCAHKECGKEFATQWADPALKDELGLARETSERFEMGRNFCNKLWNAARFAFRHLQGAPCLRLDPWALPPEDRWILARLSLTIRRYHERVQSYQFSASVKELRDFFWDCLCDWYIELVKPRLTRHEAEGDQGGSPKEARRHEGTEVREDERSEAAAVRERTGGETDPARQVLAFCLDQALRLWHPTIPFITERLWQQLNAIISRRGLPGVADLATDGDLIKAPFPPERGYPELEDEEILTVFAELQDAARAVRDLRTQCSISPKQRIEVTVGVPPEHVEPFQRLSHILKTTAWIETLHVASHARRPPNSAGVSIHGLRVYVHDAGNDELERRRTAKCLAEIEKQIGAKQAKLGNEGFVSRAKAEVVEAERQRLAEMLDQRNSLQLQLAELTES